MTDQQIAEWLAAWLPVRTELMARVDRRARQDKRFVRRYAELDIEAVDAALRNVADIAKSESGAKP